MKRHAIQILIGFILFSSTAYLCITAVQDHYTKTILEAEASRILHREAQLVDYFCLGGMPMAGGKTTIPTEWEKALGSSIRLRDGVGETTSDSPELAPHIERIRTLNPGESVFAKPVSTTDSRYILAYRPKMMNQQRLVVTKTNESLRSSLVVNLTMSPMVIAILIGASVAILQTLAIALLVRNR